MRAAPRLVIRRGVVNALLTVSIALETLAFRLGEPCEGDRFDARLSNLLDVLQTRRDAIRGRRR